MPVFLEQVRDVASTQVEMNRVRRPAESLGIRQTQHQLHFILVLHQLALRMIVRTGTDAVLGTEIAEPIPKFAGDAEMLSHQNFIRTRGAEYSEQGGAERL